MSKVQIPAENILAEPDYDYEGFIDYAYNGYTYKIWYGRIGSGSLPPLLVFHGGPGGNHHNLVAFQALANERPVIFYDQLGCGKSDRPNDSSLWNTKRYFDEARAVQDCLDLKEYHLIGHSWGTMLAVGFAARYPGQILSISLHSPILSFPYYISHVAPKLKQGLNYSGGGAGQVIDDYELDGRGRKRDYDEACMEFIKRYVTHTWPLPEAMKRLIAVRNTEIHDVMVGSNSELNVLGNLQAVDVTAELSGLDMPILMTCGDDDLCTPAFTKWQAGLAKGTQCHIIKGSGHMTPVDKPEELIRLQGVFLKEAEDLKNNRTKSMR